MEDRSQPSPGELAADAIQQALNSPDNKRLSPQEMKKKLDEAVDSAVDGTTESNTGDKPAQKDPNRFFVDNRPNRFGDPKDTTNDRSW